MNFYSAGNIHIGFFFIFFLFIYSEFFCMVYEMDLDQEKAYRRSECGVRLYGVTSITDWGPNKYTYNKPIPGLGPTVDQ